MNKKILAFLVALLSFMAIIPIHSDVLADLPVLPLPISTDLASHVGAMTEYFSGRPRLEEINSDRVLVVGRIDGNTSAFEQILSEIRKDFSVRKNDSVVFLGDYLSKNDPEGNACILSGLSRLHEAYPGRVFILRGANENDLSLGDSTFFSSREHEFLKRFLQSLPCAAIVNNRTFLSYGTVPRNAEQSRKLFQWGHMTYSAVCCSADYNSYKNIVTQLTCGHCFSDESQTEQRYVGYSNISTGAVSCFLEYVRREYPDSYRYGGYDLRNLCYAVFGNNVGSRDGGLNSYFMSRDGVVTLFRSGPGGYIPYFSIVAIDGNLPPRFYFSGAFEPNHRASAPRKDSSLLGWAFGWLWSGK